MAYEVLQSESVFQGKVFGVRIDQVKSPTGKSMRVDLVEHGGAIALIPIDDQQRFWFVRQYRHPAGEILLELPAGTLEPGEDPESCAIRECREEIGMSPGQLTLLGGAFLAPGYSTEFIHFFIAEDLSPSSLAPDEDEELHVELLTWEQIRERITRKEVRDAKTLAGLFLARSHLQDLFS
jgi:ADP-ribose pyrophosphatase